MKPLSTAFSPEVLAELARPVRTHDPRDAEITEGIDPKWYVIEVYSRVAESELAKRRFGIYVPVVDEIDIVRGRKVMRHVQLVPGYVFVLLWESDANWCRLSATAGVASILGWIEDAEIDRLRYHESCEQIDVRSRRAVRRRLLEKVHRKRVGSSRRKKLSRAQRRRVKTKNCT